MANKPSESKEEQKIQAKSNEYIIGIDAGTSSVRVILFDKYGNIVNVCGKEIELISNKPGWIEQSGTEIIDKIYKCVDTILTTKINNELIKKDSIKAVGITSQRETTILWDIKTNKPLHNAIVWQDSRTQNIVDELIKKAGNDMNKYKKICGLPLSTYFSATKILWYWNNIKLIKDKINKEECMFGTIDSWIIWNLMNKHVTDVTNASRTMLMNINTLDWDNDLMKTFGIPNKLKFPKILPSSAYYGDIINGPLKGYPLTGVIGDQQGATLGQLCINKGNCKCTYGTGAFIMCNTGKDKVFNDNGLLTTVLYKFEDEKDATYALEGSINIAGQSLRFLRDNLGIINGYNQASALASKVDDTNGVYFVTSFNGLYAPYWNNKATGLLYGLNMSVKKEHICRATFESVCFRTTEIVELINNSGIKLNQLNVDGGMTKSNIMLQIQSDLIQIPVIKPKNIETTALGSVICAGLCKKIKFWNDLKDAKKHLQQSNTIFKPKISNDIATAKLIKWKEIIKKALD